jgi:hypothetical protein
MAYSKLISSSSPGLILILLDQSYSMNEPYTGGENKATVATMAVNRVIYETTLLCQSGNQIRNRVFMGVVGYGASVRPLVGGKISELAANPVSEVNIPKKVPDGAGGLVEISQRMPLWITPPVAANGTPMEQAMEIAHGLVQSWLQEENHKDSFPPVVINISDGAPNRPQETQTAAQKLLQLQTNDGKLLLFNAHISDARAGEVALPNNQQGLHDQYAQFLFGISSVIPPSLVSAAQKAGFTVPQNARGFVFNAGAETLIKLLTFGSTGSMTALAGRD